MDVAEEGGSGDRAAQAGDVARAAAAAQQKACERQSLRERRQALGIADDAPTIGLALSGGGIRSATFCLGLMRGLARQGVLARFDYLSTVSGGGYAGAMFGRLVARVGIARAQEILADSDSRPLWWLRRYGRYLAPGGARDYGIGIATFLRAFLAVHVEFAFLALAIGLVTVLPHALHVQTGLFTHDYWRGWNSALWPLAAAVWLLLAPGLMGAYWMLRDPPRTPVGVARDARFRPWDAGVACASAVAGILILVEAWSARPDGLPPPTVRLWIGCMLSGLGVSGLALAVRLWRRRRDAAASTVAESRRYLTALLRGVNVVAAVLALLGALDWASWELQEAIRSSRFGLFGGLGLGGVLLIVARAANEPIQKRLQPQAGVTRNVLPLIVNVLGLGLAFALLVAWTTVVQWLVFAAPTFGACPTALHPAVCDVLSAWPEAGPLWQSAALGILLVIWFACTGTNLDSANTTSLHNMYAARLVRAYLGAVNPARFSGHRLDGGTAGMAGPDVPVTELHDDDDPSLAGYRPAEHGGPIHLVNVCLNQTRGRQTRLYNADRKGVPMAVSACGAEVDGEPVPELPVDTLGTLGRWVAISGAAASPGAGANTSPGWSALLFLGGARLGYWLGVGDALGAAPVDGDALRRLRRRLADTFAATKMGRLSAEFSARFDGPYAPDWYLSDGGHFDNTGAHALLRRQLDFIVLADCGADPDYNFADLENLVRKARIDHGAEIEFYSTESAVTLPEAAGEAMRILAPEEMADNFTARGVLLARILYKPGDDGTRRQGTLLVVKPNLHVALDVDVLAYARRNARFPQQTTGDQFFDEAQWESYYRLGQDFGDHLRQGWLSSLPGWSTTIALRHAPDRIRTCPLVRAVGEGAPNRPFWRDPRQAAVGALSLGAVFALALPMWQALQELRAQRENERRTLGHLVEDAEEALSAPTASGHASADLRQRLLVVELMGLSAKVPRGSAESAAARAFVEKASSRCPKQPSVPVICEEIANQLRSKSGSRAHYWARVPVPAVDMSTRIVADLVVLVGSVSPHRKAVRAPDRAPASEPASSVEQSSMAVSTESGPDGAATPAAADTPPAVAALSAAQPAWPPVGAACDHVVLYVQIHDEASRVQLKTFAWTSLEPRLRMPGIENVNLTAAVRNDPVPRPYGVPTLIVHDYAQDAHCADALRGWLDDQQRAHRASDDGAQVWAADVMSVRRLPSALSGEHHVIELWWPSASDQAPEALSP